MELKIASEMKLQICNKINGLMSVDRNYVYITSHQEQQLIMVVKLDFKPEIRGRTNAFLSPLLGFARLDHQRNS